MRLRVGAWRLEARSESLRSIQQHHLWTRKIRQRRPFDLDCEQQSVNSNLVIFLLISDWESNTKMVGNIHSFPTGIYSFSSNQRFRFYDFLCADGLLKTIILDRLSWWRKNKFLGCSGGIILLSWIPKRWRTLPAFHQLYIQTHRTNSLQDMEFCASAKLLKTELNSTTVERNKILKLRQFWNSQIAEYQSVR
jgi:hypothetical protein